MNRWHLLPLVAVVGPSACATIPAGPSVMVLPGQGKTFEQFPGEPVKRRQVISGEGRIYLEELSSAPWLGEAMTREAKERSGCGLRWSPGPLLLTPISWVSPTASAAAVILFLQNGRTIQADRTEILGDRVRIEKPTKTIELPRSAVVSIHPVSSPTASPTGPRPAEGCRGLMQQMTGKVRREIQSRPPPRTGAFS